MLIKALKSFSGAINMKKNEEKDVPDKYAEELVSVGYAEEVAAADVEVEKITKGKGKGKEKVEENEIQ